MGVASGLCKARNCLGKAENQAVIVARPVELGFPIIFETGLLVCKDHCTQEISGSVMTDDNWKVISETLQENGVKITKRQLEVNFARYDEKRSPKPPG